MTDKRANGNYNAPRCYDCDKVFTVKSGVVACPECGQILQRVTSAPDPQAHHDAILAELTRRGRPEPKPVKARRATARPASERTIRSSRPRVEWQQLELPL